MDLFRVSLQDIGISTYLAHPWIAWTCKTRVSMTHYPKLRICRLFPDIDIFPASTGFFLVGFPRTPSILLWLLSSLSGICPENYAGK